MATKQEQEVARQQRDALIQLTTDVKYIRLAMDKAETEQKEINKSMLALHEKADDRLDAVEKEILATRNRAKGMAWGAALGGGTGGAGLVAFLGKLFSGGG